MASNSQTRLYLDLSKVESLDGTNYKRWSQRMLIAFEQVEVDYVLFKDAPKPIKQTNVVVDVPSTPIAGGTPQLPPTSSQTTVIVNEAEIKKFDRDNKFVRGHLLNLMKNNVFDLYVKIKSAKTMWEALEKKYGADDAGKKKYVTGNWLNFKMVDSKPIMDQVHVYENLVTEILAEGMKMCEILQANVLIEKLPDSWSDYRNHLKHKKRDLTLEELVSHMKIEEANRLKDVSIKPKNELASKANLVESNSDSDRKTGDNRAKGGKSEKKGNLPAKGKIEKKNSVKCWSCGNVGHFASQYKNKKKKGSTGGNKNQAHLAEKGDDDVIAAVVSEVNLVENNSEWIVDTGASKHFCANKDLFVSMEEAKAGEQVYMGNSSSSEVLGRGKVVLKLTSGKTLALHNVMYVPSLRRNLISGALLNKVGVKLVFDANKLVLTRNGEYVGKGYLSGGLFVLEIVSDSSMNKFSSSAYIVESFKLWHGRLGHVGITKLKQMKSLNLLPNMSLDGLDKCEVCAESKFVKKPYRTVTKRETTPLELIHTDLADFKNLESRGGKRYYITFVDDCSRYSRVFLLRSKDEAESKFLVYKAEVENQLDRKIKRVRSDRGGEYGSGTLKDLCESEGIIHEVSAPYTPQQNGVAERKNRTLKEMMNAMLLSSGLPDNLWGEAVLSANYVQNRVTHKKLGKTPYEIWKGYAPNLSYLKVWGCLAKVGYPSFKRSTVGSRTYDAVFIGYAENSAAYRFMSLEDSSISESRDAEFFEQVFPLKKIVDTNDVSSVPSSTEPSDTSPRVEESVQPRRSKRQRVETSFGPDFLTAFVAEFENHDELEDDLDEIMVCLQVVDDDPKTFEEAMSSVDASFWKEAIDSELDSIMSNGTWELVDLPKGSKAIGCKWIFKKKLKTDGTVERFKARLVIRGFTQKFGLDYFYTYSPVTKIATIRVLFALASSYNLIVHQMDVKTAFLNGDLEEELYMEQPPGFVVPGKENKVCRLKKSLYGLKQAPKQWYEKFHNTILSFGFVVNGSDACVYSKMFGAQCVILCLYVDDMLLFGTNMYVIDETKKFLNSKFEMKDLGEVDVILGVKVTKTKKGYFLSQSHYVEKILKNFDCFELPPLRTPYDPSGTLIKNVGDSVSQTEYAKVLGSLMFLMNCTRPDIAFAVSRLSRYTHNPSTQHWVALRRVLRYLGGTMKWGLNFVGHPLVLEGFCDANWVTDSDETSSTSGYVFTLCGGAISWKSGKQTCIARSTMEAEFIALDLATQEADWLRNLLIDIPLWGKPTPPVSIHCDSQAAICVAKNSVYNGKKRHIRVRHESVRQFIVNGVVSLDFVRSEKNLADPFTKGLSHRMVVESSTGMGLRPLLY